MGNVWQIFLPDGEAYLIVEGDLPRGDAETCIVQAFGARFPISIARDDDGTTFSIRDVGSAYVTWRPGAVVAGSREQVTASTTKADGSSSAQRRSTWAARIAELPADGDLALWSQDALVTNVLGIETLHYILVMTVVRQKPSPMFHGRVTATYASSDDAKRGALAAQQGALAIGAPSPQIAEAFRRMRVVQRGSSVEFAFDHATFEGIDLSILQSWLGAAAAPTASADDSAETDAAPE